MLRILTVSKALFLSTVSSHPFTGPQALKKQIKVYAAGLPMVTLGDEYACSGGVLQLCYLRHAFGLGAHYNSVVPQGVEDG